VEPDLSNGPRLARARRADDQLDPDPEPLLGEVGFEVDDHLPAIAVRARDPAHEEEIAGSHVTRRP
jgi:hypothetical protein